MAYLQIHLGVDLPGLTPDRRLVRIHGEQPRIEPVVEVHRLRAEKVDRLRHVRIVIAVAVVPSGDEEAGAAVVGIHLRGAVRPLEPPPRLPFVNFHRPGKPRREPIAQWTVRFRRVEAILGVVTLRIRDDGPPGVVHAAGRVAIPGRAVRIPVVGVAPRVRRGVFVRRRVDGPGAHHAAVRQGARGCGVRPDGFVRPGVNRPRARGRTDLDHLAPGVVIERVRQPSPSGVRGQLHADEEGKRPHGRRGIQEGPSRRRGGDRAGLVVKRPGAGRPAENGRRDLAEQEPFPLGQARQRRREAPPERVGHSLHRQRLLRVVVGGLPRRRRAAVVVRRRRRGRIDREEVRLAHVGDGYRARVPRLVDPDHLTGVRIRLHVHGPHAGLEPRGKRADESQRVPVGVLRDDHLRCIRGAAGLEGVRGSPRGHPVAGDLDAPPERVLEFLVDDLAEIEPPAHAEPAVRVGVAEARAPLVAGVHVAVPREPAVVVGGETVREPIGDRIGRRQGQRHEQIEVEEVDVLGRPAVERLPGNEAESVLPDRGRRRRRRQGERSDQESRGARDPGDGPRQRVLPTLLRAVG